MLQVPLLGLAFSTNLTAWGPAGPHCICRRGHHAACRLLLAGVWGESESSVPDAGSSAPAPAPAVSLPPEDTHRVTGEEEERSVYTGEGHCHSDADIGVSDKAKLWERSGKACPLCMQAIGCSYTSARSLAACSPALSTLPPGSYTHLKFQVDKIRHCRRWDAVRVL